jgi:hypothetical protein
MYGKTRDQGFGAEVKRRILMGTYALSAGYYDAFYKRAQQVKQQAAALVIARKTYLAADGMKGWYALARFNVGMYQSRHRPFCFTSFFGRSARSGRLSTFSLELREAFTFILENFCCLCVRSIVAGCKAVGENAS